MKIRKLFAAVLALCCMVSMFSVASAEETLTIGVIGPTRMQYGRVLSVLNAMGQQLTDLLGQDKE